MQIQRQRFLAFCAAIAAESCAPSGQPGPAQPAPAAAPTPRVPPIIEPRDDDAPENAALTSPACPANAGALDCSVLPPAPQCEGLGFIMRDCDALLKTLEPDVAQSVLECTQRNSDVATCNFPLAQCLRDELNRSCGEAAEPQCDAIQRECEARRERRQQRWGKSSFEPWLVTADECRRASANTRAEFKPEVLTCLSEMCHPTACFSGSPMALVSRAERKKTLGR